MSYFNNMKKIFFLALLCYISLSQANSPQEVVMCQNLKVMGYSIHSSIEGSSTFEIINAHKYFFELDHKTDEKNKTHLKINPGNQIKEYIIKNDCDAEYEDILEIE